MGCSAQRYQCAVAQDAKVVLAEVRELKFALEESNEAAEHLQSELATAQVTGRGIWCQQMILNPGRQPASKPSAARSCHVV